MKHSYITISLIIWFAALTQNTAGFLRIFLGDEKKLGLCHDTNNFTCRNGDCIDINFYCDGKMDCLDNSDEDNCDYVKCLLPNYVRCPNKMCIPASAICNGINDCVDGFDEKHCDQELKASSSAGCSTDEFQCRNMRCIKSDFVCDGVVDCDDSSDELMGCVKKQCKEYEFRCKNQHCINRHSRCDAYDDCGDNSDEESCERVIVDLTDCTLKNKKYPCKDRYSCLDLRNVCNSAHDCYDGSDEGGHCNSSADTCPHCAHECVKTPDGPICLCNPGYVENKNKICEDVNECEEYGICDQKCINLPSTYKCSCDVNHILQSDNRTCKIKGANGFLVYSTSHKIMRLELENHNSYIIADKQSMTTGVAVSKDYVYWTIIHKGSQAIVRSTLNGGVQEAVVTSGLGSPEDLAVDWITMNIYFTDARYRRIGVCGSDKFICAVLHNENIDKPRAITVSPELRIMFWTDWGAKPLIGRSDMDGSNVMAVVTTKLHWPNGVAVDVPNERLYWVDAKLHVIETIRFDGNDRRVVLSEYVKHPFSIAVFENKLYWSDWRTKEILVCNKFTGKEKRTVISERTSKIYGMRVYHAQSQINAKNPCANSGCSDLCLLAPNELHYSCACPDNKKLNANRMTCDDTVNAQTLIAAYKNNIYAIEYQHLGRHNVRKYSLDVFSISALAYDSRQGNIILADSSSMSIYLFNLRNEHRLTPLISNGVGVVHSMEYDNVGNNLYWCDWNSLSVEAISLNTLARTVVWSVTNSETPIDLALVPEKGFMFVALVFSYEHAHIDRISMDGSFTSKQHFIETDLLGFEIKLHFNKELNRLFWSDVITGNIETVDIDGNDRRKFASSQFASCMTSFDDTLFWSSRNSSAIYWDSLHELEGPQKIDLDIESRSEDDSIQLVVTAQSLANDTSSPCYNNNGGCSHLCLVSHESSNKKVCACPLGYSLSVDDLNCKKPKKCSADGEFQCFTGECLPLYRVCDKRKDCLHGEDELVNNCHRENCPSKQFLCFDRQQCIDRSLKCNGQYDCNDKSDEICNVDCNGTKFWCDSGECIDIQFRCDGKVDCKDGHDEMNCVNTTCSSDQFRCLSGQCIPKFWHCDNEPDCVDGSDENENCTTGCSPSEFRCTNGKCINVALTCDTNDDCGDLSDEKIGCEKNHNYYVERSFYYESDHAYKVCNSYDEFHCITNTSHCLPVSSICNGVKECLNGEDEKHCKFINDCQKDSDFRCSHFKKCIPHEWVCDGDNDCGDHSDEDAAVCVQKNITGTECHGFRCKNGECISKIKACNGIGDCPDKSDEGGECEKQICKNFGCMQICHELPTGPECSCEFGYKLDAGGKSCVDIDECELEICSQNCTNTLGSFVCSCFSPEYALRSDRTSCKATGKPMVYVVASDVRVQVISNHLHHMKGLISAPYSFLPIIQIDVDVHRNQIYALLDGGPLLRSSSTYHGSEILNIFHVTDFAVDWITENVYLVELHSAIVVTDLNKNNTSLIYHTKFESHIWALAADPVAGYLFWFESGIKKEMGKIVRADCTGNNVRHISTDFQYLINQLVVDSFGSHVYYLNEITRAVYRLDYDGSNFEKILHVETSIITFTFFENYIYWVTRNSNSFPIKKCKIYGLPPRKCETIEISMPQIRHFSILQANRQRSVANPCTTINCDGVCVKSPDGPVCLCHAGKISQTNQTCNAKTTSWRGVIVKSELSTSGDRNKNGISTFLSCFIIICFVVGVIIVRYYYYKPKSHIFQRLHFHNAAYNQHPSNVLNCTEPYANEITIQKGGNSFIEALSEECEEPEFHSCHRMSRESLIKS